MKDEGHNNVSIIGPILNYSTKRACEIVETPVIDKSSGSFLMMIEGLHNLAKRRVASKYPGITDVIPGKYL